MKKNGFIKFEYVTKYAIVYFFYDPYIIFKMAEHNGHFIRLEGPESALFPVLVILLSSLWSWKPLRWYLRAIGGGYLPACGSVDISNL